MSFHLKRLAQPRRWMLPKKVKVWAPKPSPGPHGAAHSLPLLLLVRDTLHLADRAREARRIISAGQVLVDGVAVRDTNRGVGLMDVVALPALELTCRVLYDRNGRLALVKVPADQASWKLVRVEGKVVQKKGRVQLNLHDGRNIIVKEGDFATGDVLKLKVPIHAAGERGPVAERYPFGPGAPVFVTGGAHTGELAKVVRETAVRANAPNRVTLAGEGGEFETVKPYAFVVGKDKPLVGLPEVSVVA